MLTFFYATEICLLSQLNFMVYWLTSKFMWTLNCYYRIYHDGELKPSLIEKWIMNTLSDFVFGSRYHSQFFLWPWNKNKDKDWGKTRYAWHGRYRKNIYIYKYSSVSGANLCKNIAMTHTVWPKHTHLMTKQLLHNLCIAYKLAGRMRGQQVYPESKVYGANMGPIWDRQDPSGPHAGPMNFAIWVALWIDSPIKWHRSRLKIFSCESRVTWTYFQWNHGVTWTRFQINPDSFQTGFR